MESFARAAENLNMSGPAVSQQIRSLEGHLGKSLFVRGPSHVKLTREGQAFLPVVHQSLAAIETTAMALFSPGEREHITVQVIDLLAQGWFPTRLPLFEQEHPDVRVHIQTANQTPEFQAAGTGREPDVQIAFGSASEFPDSAVRLFGETISVVARPDIAAKIRTVSDLKNIRLYDVVPHQCGWHQVLNSAAGEPVHGDEIVMVDNTPTALMMAATGNGLALSRTPASDDLVANLGLSICEELPTATGIQHYYLMTSETRRLSPGAIAFREWIVQMASSVSAADEK